MLLLINKSSFIVSVSLLSTWYTLELSGKGNLSWEHASSIRLPLGKCGVHFLDSLSMWELQFSVGNATLGQGGPELYKKEGWVSQCSSMISALVPTRWNEPFPSQVVLVMVFIPAAESRLWHSSLYKCCYIQVNRLRYLLWNNACPALPVSVTIVLKLSFVMCYQLSNYQLSNHKDKISPST